MPEDDTGRIGVLDWDGTFGSEYRSISRKPFTCMAEMSSDLAQSPPSNLMDCELDRRISTSLVSKAELSRDRFPVSGNIDSAGKFV
jgi:hypothetical protein